MIVLSSKALFLVIEVEVEVEAEVNGRSSFP